MNLSEWLAWIGTKSTPVKKKLNLLYWPYMSHLHFLFHQNVLESNYFSSLSHMEWISSEHITTPPHEKAKEKNKRESRKMVANKTFFPNFWYNSVSQGELIGKWVSTNPISSPQQPKRRWSKNTLLSLMLPQVQKAWDLSDGAKSWPR